MWKSECKIMSDRSLLLLKCTIHSNPLAAGGEFGQYKMKQKTEK